MNRVRAFCVVWLLLDMAACFGQAQCAPKCAPTKYAPISGRVTDASDGRPLANALVSYQGLGDGFPSMGSNVALNPPSIKGSVRTASDGSYTLALLPPLGGYEVRASAPGYMSSQEFLGEQPVGFHREPRSLPIPGCTADCTIALPDGNFKLQPDVIELRPMSSEARTKFALPGDYPGLHWIETMAFSPDGIHAAFITRDSFALNSGQSCLGWNYNLSSGQLVRTTEALPSGYCDGIPPEMAWDGNALFLHVADYHSNISSREEAMRWDGAEMTSVRPEDLPIDFRQALARKAEMFLSNATEEEDDPWAQTTADGQFHLSSGPGDGGQCFSLSIATKKGDWKQNLGACVWRWDYLLDREHDFLVLYEPRRLAQDEPPFQKLTLLDLKAHSRRSYLIPQTNSIVQLLAEQRLADGATRVAYSIEGDCDPASPDAAHTATFGQAVNSNRPRNLCFVRIPAK